MFENIYHYLQHLSKDYHLKHMMVMIQFFLFNR